MTLPVISAQYFITVSALLNLMRLGFCGDVLPKHGHSRKFE